MGELKLSIDFNATSGFNESQSPEDEEVTPRNYTTKSTVEETIDRLKNKRKQEGGILIEEMSENESTDNNLGIKRKDIIKDKKWNSKKKKDDDFFDELDINSAESKSFQNLNISTRIVKAIMKLNWNKPTTIQSNAIPIILQGKDVCACAVTGSGKTGAFMVPIIERLFCGSNTVKSIGKGEVRVLVITPTRELAIQIEKVSRSLLKFIDDISVVCTVGGVETRDQDALLRQGVDIAVATPGRLIDHVFNTPGFSLNAVEILVLDEADRMLEDGFSEQIKEIIGMCNRSRQTLLFSATMTDEVDELVGLSLKKPTKIFVNENTEVNPFLEQEFVRVRNSNTIFREAILAALIKRSFKKRVIVFVQTKVLCHRLHIMLALMDVNVGELNGNLSQEQRISTLNKFNKNEIDILVATDLAARGIDIPEVSTVINFTMPATLKHYIHRVGRTARAGKEGRSITLWGEDERKILKDVIRNMPVQPKSRTVPTSVIVAYQTQIDSLEEDIKEVFRMETEERNIRAAEHQIHKAEQMLDGKFEEDRQWYKNRKDKKNDKVNEQLSKLKRSKKKKKREPLSRDLEKVIQLSARKAKKDQQVKKMTVNISDKKTKFGKKKVKKSTFGKEPLNKNKVSKNYKNKGKRKD